MIVTDADTTTRARTRAAILQAAFVVLAEDAGAALGRIADAAGVARSTLHRYYPDREALLVAMRDHAAAEAQAAVAAARLADGPADVALARLCSEYFARWDLLTWGYFEAVSAAEAASGEAEELDPALSALIGRGQAEGTIDPALPDRLLQAMIWALLYAAATYVRHGGNRHETLTLMLTTLRRLVTPGDLLTAAGAARAEQAAPPMVLRAVGTVLPVAATAPPAAAVPLAAALAGPGLRSSAASGPPVEPAPERTGRH